MNEQDLPKTNEENKFQETKKNLQDYFATLNFLSEEMKQSAVVILNKIVESSQELENLLKNRKLLVSTVLISLALVGCSNDRLIKGDDYWKEKDPVAASIYEEAELQQRQEQEKKDVNREIKVGDQVLVNTNGTGLNLRSKPGVDSAIIQTLPDRTSVTVTEIVFEIIDGYRWVKVEGSFQDNQYQNQFLIGYVAEGPTPDAAPEERWLQLLPPLVP